MNEMEKLQDRVAYLERMLLGCRAERSQTVTALEENIDGAKLRIAELETERDEWRGQVSELLPLRDGWLRTGNGLPRGRLVETLRSYPAGVGATGEPRSVRLLRQLRDGRCERITELEPVRNALMDRVAELEGALYKVRIDSAIVRERAIRIEVEVGQVTAERDSLRKRVAHLERRG